MRRSQVEVEIAPRFRRQAPVDQHGDIDCSGCGQAGYQVDVVIVVHEGTEAAAVEFDGEVGILNPAAIGQVARGQISVGQGQLRIDRGEIADRAVVSLDYQRNAKRGDDVQDLVLEASRAEMIGNGGKNIPREGGPRDRFRIADVEMA